MAFAFTYLIGTEIAGYTSINALIQSIDTQLTSRIPNKDTSGTGAFNAYVPVYDSTQASGFSQALITSSNILNDTIVNADINSAAGIVDTKLATISTAGKVANSATTAASANGNSTIVARDASGNFAADTITASGFVGTATRATNIVGGSAGNVPYQTGTSTTGLLASGSDGQVLTYSSSGSAPTWANISSGSVTLAGDVTGAANANTITALPDTKLATIATGGKVSNSATTATISNTASTIVLRDTNGFLVNDILNAPIEVFATRGAMTGTVNYDVITQAVLYANVNATGNWTLNVRGDGTPTTLDTLLGVNQAMTITLINQNGTTAYYQTAMTIDGVSVTPKWSGGTAPFSGSPSANDIYTFTILKTASATYTVLASVVKWGL